MAYDVSIWMVLTDPKRRQIINLLEEKPRTTSDLFAYYDVASMKRLKLFVQANLVTASRQGCILMQQHLKPFIEKGIPYQVNP